MRSVAWTSRAALVVGLVVLMAACSSGPSADSPAAVVQDALGRVAAKDVDGLRTLACAGQEDAIREQLGLPAELGQLLPGLDMDALLDAVQLDVGGAKVGDPAIDGDTAQVPVTGSVKVSFDADTIRPIVKQLLEQQGVTLSDEQVDSMLNSLEAFGQDVPLDESVRLVREDGAWKICQEP